MVKHFFLTIIFVFIFAQKTFAFGYKQLAAPPEDMPQNASQMKSVQLQSNTAILPVNVDSQTMEADIEIKFEENYPVHIVPLVDDRVFGSSSVISPDGTAKGSAVGDVASIMSVEEQTDSNRFTNAKSGVWKIKLQRTPGGATIQSLEQEPEHFLTHVLVASESPYRLYTKIKKRNFILGQTIEFDAHFGLDGKDLPLKGAITELTARIIHPDKSEKTIEFQNESAQGFWSANFNANQVGHYSVLMKAVGSTPEGDNFIRTSEHYFPVIERSLELTGKASLDKTYQTSSQNNRVPVDIETKVLKPIKRVQISAELWSDDKAINWFGGIVPVNEKEGKANLSSSVDVRWLYKGQAIPTQLKNVELIDPDTHIVLSRFDRIRLEGTEEASALFDMNMYEIAESTSMEIDEEMLQGPAMSEDVQPSDLAQQGPSLEFDHQASILPFVESGDSGGRSVLGSPIWDGNLLLVHGYCSDGEFWPENVFTNAYRFSDPDKNRSIDKFARLIERVTRDSIPHYGIIAHSQGGMAALHMYTYYRSPLDIAAKRMSYLKKKYNMPEMRLIQTIGTPFLGTPLAGWIATLVRIFGVQCGSNYDLTPDGAAAWLSRIPAWAKRQVYYHTTSYHSCSLATRLMLSRPNDGVTESKRATLNGGTFVSHTFDHCHTNSMNKPAQYDIRKLNEEMNRKAAR